jgi:CheY-like chemotaxis protein
MTTDPADLSPRRILVVDDERQIFAAIRLRLGRECELSFCPDPAQALECVARERFDLCFADIHMPQMDGLEFVEAAQKADPALGFVILTAFDTPENLKRAIPLHVYDFIPKPLPERAGFEALVPGWIRRTHERRRQQTLLAQAGVLAGERDGAVLDREIEFVASETARDALLQTAGLLTTIQAHLTSAVATLAPRARNDAATTALFRGLVEAQKTADAAISVAERYFDSAYGSRDTSPARLAEGVRRAAVIAARMVRAEERGVAVDLPALDEHAIVAGLHGIDLWLLLIPVLGIAIQAAPERSTVRIGCEPMPRLETVVRDPRWRNACWFNRRRGAGGSSGWAVSVAASALPPTQTTVDAWLRGERGLFAPVSPSGLFDGLAKCRGFFGLAVAPAANQLRLVAALPG